MIPRSIVPSARRVMSYSGNPMVEGIGSTLRNIPSRSALAAAGTPSERLAAGVVSLMAKRGDFAKGAQPPMIHHRSDPAAMTAARFMSGFKVIGIGAMIEIVMAVVGVVVECETIHVLCF